MPHYIDAGTHVKDDRSKYKVQTFLWVEMRFDGSNVTALIIFEFFRNTPVIISFFRF